MKKLIFVLLLALFLLPCAGYAYDAMTEYGYDQLGGMPEGEQLQAFYRTVQEMVASFGEGDSDAPEDLILAFYATEDTGLTADQMGAVFTTLDMDHPEYFWVAVESATEYSHGLEVRTFPECRTAAQRQEIAQAISQKADQMINLTRAKAEGADIMTVAAEAQDALLDGMEYDLKAPLSHTIAGAFWGEKGVCDSYAKAYKYLLQRLGIFSLVVIGDAGEPHAWVYIQDENGRFFYVDPTWNDRWLGSGRRDYFDLPEEGFLQSHKPGPSDVCAGLEYCYPLPPSGIDKPAYQALEGVWLDSGAHVGETASYAEAFDVLVPLCREAVLHKNAAFALPASEAEAIHLSEIMPYLAIRMQDEADLAGVFADLTEMSLNDGVLTVGISLYEPGTAPCYIAAYADGAPLGQLTTIAQVFDACKDRQDIGTLDLVLQEYQHFYLPENLPVPAVERLILRNSDTDREVLALNLWTLRGWAPNCDVELCRLFLHQIMPMTLDLTGHELTLRNRVIIGSYNFDSVVDQSTQSWLICGRLIAKDTGYKETFCNVKADEVRLEDAYRLSFRGTDVSVQVTRLAAYNDGEFLPTGIDIGNGAADTVTAEIGELVIDRKVLFILGVAPGNQNLLLESVDNTNGEWPMTFFVSMLDGPGESEFILPRIEISGAFNTYAHMELQYSTGKTYEAVGTLFPEGTPLLKVPQGKNADWYVSISIDASYDYQNAPNSYDFHGGLYGVTFTEDGTMLLGEKK